MILLPYSLKELKDVPLKSKATRLLQPASDAEHAHSSIRTATSIGCQISLLLSARNETIAGRWKNAQREGKREKEREGKTEEKKEGKRGEIFN